jgi:hypothetical protein
MVMTLRYINKKSLYYFRQYSLYVGTKYVNFPLHISGFRLLSGIHIHCWLHCVQWVYSVLSALICYILVILDKILNLKIIKLLKFYLIPMSFLQNFVLPIGNK